MPFAYALSNLESVRSSWIGYHLHPRGLWCSTQCFHLPQQCVQHFPLQSPRTSRAATSVFVWNTVFLSVFGLSFGIWTDSLCFFGSINVDVASGRYIVAAIVASLLMPSVLILPISAIAVWFVISVPMANPAASPVTASSRNQLNFRSACKLQDLRQKRLSDRPIHTNRMRFDNPSGRQDRCWLWIYPEFQQWSMDLQENQINTTPCLRSLAQPSELWQSNKLPASNA